MTLTTNKEKKIWIPEMPKGRICELAKRIKPIVRMARIRTSSKKHDDGSLTITERPHPKGRWEEWHKGDHHYIQPVDLFGVAYT